MAEETGLAADALSGLEDESRDAALGVLYGASASTSAEPGSEISQRSCTGWSSQGLSV